MDISTLIIFIVVLGLIFDYTNGFHDASNVVSTVIATRALTPIIAILLAGVLNALGAMQISGVAQTITSGLVNAHESSQMMVICALVGAIAWNLITWYYGIPSSSSYALIGGLVGAALFEGGFAMVIWKGVVTKVLIPMAISPFVGFFLAFSIMKSIDFFRFGHRRKSIFRYLQIGSASLVAIAHGMNDAQKSMGVITLGLFSAGLIATQHIPLWVILVCALMMGIGTAFGGFRIIQTVGFKITKLETTQGFAAEMGSSLVILAASFFGMPISTTHMVVGSVAGVGGAKGLSKVRWGISQKLVTAWILTIPGAAAVSFCVYKLISKLLIIK
jgi:inorganic phosphate transporter, PiT family